MADNKLNNVHLRQAIIDRTDATEREANLFLRVLVEQIIAGLQGGEQIKINGLGIFRLQEMAPRKSVNVNTGEPIIIPGYTKVVFAPEVSMREMVEKNKSVTPIVNLNADTSAAPVDEEALSPLEKLGRQADEIVGILADLGQDPRMPIAMEEEKESDSTEVAASATVAEEEVAVEAVAEPEEVVEEAVEEVSVPAEEPTESPTEEPVVEPIEEPVASKEQKVSKERKKRKYHFLRDTLICVVCLLMVLAGGFLFLRGAMANWIDSLVAKREPVATDTVVAIPSTPMVEEVTKDTAVMENAPELPVYQQFIATEEIREGSRLTWLAYRYYGNKDLWVYIYDANKDHLGNPNEIRVGTPIRIPRLTTEQQDTTLQTTREVMQRLKDNAIHWDVRNKNNQ
ncbi:MAG: HU family DNA-binding protein [Paludibacteraceae bacterium]|nr:HU family DNA-binding protein [Paludibacteraceae bacterium]